ncbi:hypothetical protein [uncultured Microbacterium sp.]|uniref:hypothetical protein n=1 Tax=uncultured Microbacterium sp. TaxID=191216 RepID=UPI0028D2766A|nr:hypothetical protein [uncultured Microbacterium sp.]
MGEHALLDQVLTDADPARTPRDAPPDAAALMVRDRIIRNARASRRRRSVVIGWAAGLATVAAAAVVAVAVLMPQGQAVADGLDPLDFSSAMSAETTVATAQDALAQAPGPAAPERLVRSANWAFDINGNTGETEVVPQLTLLQWNADLSGRMTSVLGVPYDPADASANMGAEVSSSGQVAVDLTIEPGQFTTPVPDPFGSTESEVEAALTAFGMPTDPTGADVLTAMTTMLQQWTLTNAQHSQLLGILEATDDAEGLGTTVDRLGRPASGLRVVSTDGSASDVVLVSGDTGRIIGIERTNIEDTDLIDAGAVVSYTLWDVDESLVR